MAHSPAPVAGLPVSTMGHAAVPLWGTQRSSRWGTQRSQIQVLNSRSVGQTAARTLHLKMPTTKRGGDSAGAAPLPMVGIPDCQISHSIGKTRAFRESRQ